MICSTSYEIIEWILWANSWPDLVINRRISLLKRHISSRCSLPFFLQTWRGQLPTFRPQVPTISEAQDWFGTICLQRKKTTPDSTNLCEATEAREERMRVSRWWDRRTRENPWGPLKILFRAWTPCNHWATEAAGVKQVQASTSNYMYMYVIKRPSAVNLSNFFISE